MRKRDSAKLETLERVIDTLEQHQEIFKTFKPVAARYTALKNAVPALHAMRTQLSYDSEGLTDDKQATLQTLIKQTVALAKAR